ncbi:MAG: MurR/RpiR family transcriptional regulator [Aerococcaceae bacterium]|nr:MurR/RpiR family transcriptional regulator [Aerococcaceae bacterium]
MVKHFFLKNTIRNSTQKFSDLEVQLSNYLLNLEEDEIVNKTISDMAEESSVSQSTIYNFVKKLGFAGFQNFKIQLAQNLSVVPETKKIVSISHITDSDSPLEVASKVVAFNQSALDSVLYFLDDTLLENILSDIDHAKGLNFFGQGGSSVIAFDAYQKFMRTKYWCNYDIDYHIQLVKCAKLTENDVCFLFSHSGETRETVNIAKILKERGCKIISVTGNPNSELVSLSDHVIIVFSDESKFRTESLTSRILYLTIIDIIYTCVMIRNKSENTTVLESIRKVVKEIRKR